MRSIFSQGRRKIAACLLIAILVAPSTLASDATAATTLWEEFVAWLAGRIDVPGGSPAAGETGFSDWLMGRIGVPGG